MNAISSSDFFKCLDHALFYGVIGLAFLFCFNVFNHLSEYLFLGLVALGLLKLFHEKSLALPSTPLDIPILFFLGWIALTLPFALDLTYSLEEWRKALPRFFIFWFVIYVIRSQYQVKMILYAFVIGLGILCFVETIYFFVVGGRAFSMDVRAGSFFGDSQWLSNYLVIGGPFLWVSWISQEYVWEKIMNSFVTSVFLFAFFLVHTRSVWLVAVVQLSVYILYRMTGKFLLSIGIVLLSVVAMFGSLKLSEGFRSVLSHNDFSNPYTLQVRFNTWKVAWQDVKNSPIVGTGYGKHTFQTLHPNLPKEHHQHIHNMFLGTAFQLGIPGLLLLVFIFWNILSAIDSWLKKPRERDLFSEHVALAGGLMTLGVMVRNSFDDMFHGTIVYFFFFFVALGFYLFGHRTTVWSWSKATGS